MSKKSYDQRLKERWKRKQKQEIHRDIRGGFPGLGDIYAATAVILPFLFGKRGRG